MLIRMWESCVKKPINKISALSRIRNFISPVKSRLLYNTYILSRSDIVHLSGHLQTKLQIYVCSKIKNES